MWSSLNQLSNLATQGLAAASEAVNQASEAVTQAATESLRRISNDDDTQENSQASGDNNSNADKAKDNVSTDPINSSCPVATKQDENTSETTKNITDQADQMADSFFNFASQLADEAYKNTLSFTTQAVEQANQAHAQISQQTGEIYNTIMENEVVNNVVKTVEDKTILGDFHKEQSKHINEINELNKASCLPWEGYENSEGLEEKIRALSKDERNFKRNPPNGVSFQFVYKESFQQALMVLEADEDLQKMRFALVPKKMKEEIFWRNYFYRVSLIKQSYQLKELSGSRNSLNNVEASQEKDLPGNSVGSGLGSKTTSRNSQQPADDEKPATSEDEVLEEDPNFASAEFDGQVNADDLQAEMEALGMDDNVDWEKELQDELNEYEVVPENEENQSASKKGSTATSEGWEKEVEDMLNW